MTFTIYKAKDSSQQRRRVAFGPGKASKVEIPFSRGVTICIAVAPDVFTTSVYLRL
jgi:hypothetical protein